MACHTWKELLATDFDLLDKAATLVILPIGSMEQHGPHLPVGTDTLSVESLLAGLSAAESSTDLLLLPAVWCSKSNEHLNFAGTISLSRETLSAMVDEICESVARSGFRKIVMLNWHGGNIDLLSVLARDQHQRNGLLTFVLNFGTLLASYEPTPEWIREGSFDIHAGRFETSILLAEHPHLVKRMTSEALGSDLARGRMSASFKGCKYLLPEGGPVLMGWTTDDLTADGVVGDPAGANAEEGESFMDFLVQRIIAILGEIASFEHQGRL